MSGSRIARVVMMRELQTRQTIGLVGAMLLLTMVFSSPAAAEPAKMKNGLQLIQERHRDRFREFSNELEKLAKGCDEKGLDKEAAQVRSRAIVVDSQSLRVDKLPAELRPEISPKLTGDERHWQTQLRFLETEYAKDLYVQSRQALNKEYSGYAYNLIREAAIHNPDHPHVRKILGYVQLGNEWVTPFAHWQIKKGNVWNEEFGWLQKSQVEKYIAGERRFNDRWISAEKEKELRRDFSSAWEIRTEHYLIKTNVSLESGVEMGKALEEFYSVFIETFAGFFHSPEQLQKLFNDSAKQFRPADKPPYKVHFYRTRDEYLERLRKFFPSIDQTNGVYMTSDRIAHFYYDPNQDHKGTLFHEATHQLFFESHFANRTICENHHFWIIEGIACYMESFQQKNGAFSLGDPNYIRFTGARHNLLELNYYVPLREFSGYGMQDFQTAQELAKNYTQAAGLARFFMHHDKGRYREALVKHLAQLYSKDERVRERVEGLDDLTGIDFTELDRQYAEDARQMDDQISSR